MDSFSRKRIADCVPVRKPRKKTLKEIETIRFTFHDLANRDIKEAHGYLWEMEIWHGGPPGCALPSNYKDGFACYLDVVDDPGSGHPVTARVLLRCNGFESRTVEPHVFLNHHWNHHWTVYLPKHLEDDGSLAIECDIQIVEEDNLVWYPEALQPNKFLVDIFQDASFDVLFSVEGKAFGAHKIVLSQRCQKLYEIAEESSDCTVPIPICNTTKDIFKSLLDFVYTVRSPRIPDQGSAIELLAAADRFGCVDLKLFVESILLERFLTADSAAGLLILADSHSCALLKEAAIDLCVGDADAVEGPDWPKVEESNKLVRELLRAFRKRTQRRDADEMTVAELRRNLGWVRSEVDGSREVLVRRWKALLEKEAKKDYNYAEPVFKG